MVLEGEALSAGGATWLDRLGRHKTFVSCKGEFATRGLVDARTGAFFRPLTCIAGAPAGEVGGAMDSSFRRQLQERSTDPSGRRWLFVPYDQLTDAIGPLSRNDPGELGIVLIESSWKAAMRPYHKQKLALVLANLRHFALEQAERGVAIEHHVVEGSYGEELRKIARDRRELGCMRPAERELRRDLQPLVDEGLVELLPHEGWLTTSEQYTASQGDGRRRRMDAFYRTVRRESGQARSWTGVRFGNRLVDSRSLEVPVPPDRAFAPIRRIGGETGWYACDWLWHLRGWIDLLFGGVGVRRGRPDPENLQVGDALDFWRVEAFVPDHLLRLHAEMKLPGQAWLEFEVQPTATGSTIRQTALYDPVGLTGLAYWYSVFPLHNIVFAGMLRNIARAAESEPVVSTPQEA